jgi:hypothetical protein
MTGSDTTLIALNPVRADRADEFETFLRSVVVPATHAQRPDLDGQWRVLRADEPDDEGIVLFAFVCEGGVPGDWELRPILEKQLGTQGADRAMKEFVELLSEDQSGWFFSPVSLDRP